MNANYEVCCSWNCLIEAINHINKFIGKHDDAPAYRSSPTNKISTYFELLPLSHSCLVGFNKHKQYINEYYSYTQNKLETHSDILIHNALRIESGAEKYPLALRWNPFCPESREYVLSSSEKYMMVFDLRVFLDFQIIGRFCRRYAVSCNTQYPFSNFRSL